MVNSQRQPFYVFQFNEVLLMCCYVQKIIFTIVTLHKKIQYGIIMLPNSETGGGKLSLHFCFILHLKVLKLFLFILMTIQTVCSTVTETFFYEHVVVFVSPSVRKIVSVRTDMSGTVSDQQVLIFFIFNNHS